MADVITLGSLNLMDGTKHFILPGTLDMTTPGEIRFRLMFVGTTPDARVANENAVQQTLNLAAIRARQNGGDWVAFTTQRMTTASVAFDVRRGSISPQGIEIGGLYSQADVTLVTLPYGRGDAIDLTPASLTVANGDPGILLTAIPGDCPEGALVRLELDDTSPSGVINLLQIGRYSGSGLLAATDAAPWVDTTAMIGAITTSDSSAFGGSYAWRTDTAQVDLARAVMPAGDLVQGKRDVWARVKAVGTAMGQPGTPTLTATESTKVTTSNRAIGSIDIGATGIDRKTSGTTTAPTWTAPTQDGSLLVRICFRDATTGLPNNPSGWKKLLERDFSVGVPIYSVYYIRDAPSRSGSESAVVWGTASSSATNTDVLIEILNGNAIIGYESDDDWSSAATQSIVMDTPLKSGFPQEMALALFMLTSAGTPDRTDFLWNGYTEIASVSLNGLVAAWQTVESQQAEIPVAKVTLDASYNGNGLLLHINPQMTSETVATYSDPLPGNLAAGTYTVRVQGVDTFGTRSNASASSSSVTLTNPYGALTASWTAPTGDVAQYVVTVQKGTTYREFLTGTTATSFTITDLAAGKAVSGLPATTGAVAPSPRLIPRIGTTGQASADLTTLDEIILPSDNQWHLVRLDSLMGREFPPAAATQDGERADWAVEFQQRAANGLSATVQIDGLFMTPHDEPSATIWKQGLDLATKRRWIIESHRSGRGLVVRLVDLTDGTTIKESLVADGLLTAASGMDTIISLSMAQAAGVMPLAAQMAVHRVTVWPRWGWEASS